MTLNRVLKQIFLIFLMAALSLTAAAKSDYAVATAHPLATDAARKILERGGNAFDAAIAISAVLGVVEPYSSGFGGGGFWLLYDADKQSNVMVDGREKAPLAASADMYLDAKGKPVPNLSVNGALAAGIPGMPAALVYIAKHYASLPLSVLLQPAISAAQKGFVADKVFLRLAKMRLKALQASPTASKVFLQQGQVPQQGTVIVQTDLANTIRQIAQQGKKGFYAGAVAREMVQFVRAHGGIWSMQDLAAYEAVARDPITIRYKDATIITAAPPSSGGVALAQIFNMLELFDWEKMSRTQRLHYSVEVMRRAYRDRSLWLGDTDFITLPKHLTDKSYAQQMARDIKPHQASVSVPAPSPTHQGQDTTHFSVVDGKGNKVAATLSINYPFGSAVVAGASGVLLNNEMDDFAIAPGVANLYGLTGGKANAIAPGKRMLSSMSPTFVESKDRSAVLGTPGGSRIITMVMLAVLEFLNGGSAYDIVATPRYHHQYLPDKITFEAKALDQDTQAALRKMGHHLEVRSTGYGNMQAIVMDKKSGSLDAASDPRAIGAAYSP